PGVLCARSEFELDSVLELERVGNVAWCAKSQNRTRWQVQIVSSIKGVQIRNVDAIGQVEEVRAEFETGSLVETNLARDAQVKAGETRPFQCVSAQHPRPIAGWIAVSVGVRASEHGEEPGALGGEYRTELEITQDRHVLRDLTYKGHRVSVASVLA